MGNCRPHRHATVRAWLARHPRWTFHFIPTASSWLNAADLRRENGPPDRFLILRIFAKLTRRRLKHGVFRSVGTLKTAVTRFIEQHNASEARPFAWRADPDKIIAARNRGFQGLDAIQ
jgi:hypothetical protein